jgi:hypothetical protein
MKFSSILILIYIFYSNNYLIEFSIVDYFFLQEQKAFFDFFYKLKEFNDDNIEMKNEIKANILKTLNKDKDPELNDISNELLIFGCDLGECLIFLNKYIFYCEIIGCKSIILDKEIFSFIDKDIMFKNKTITIKFEDKTKYEKYLNYYKNLLNLETFFGYKQKIKINLIKDEIYQYLPKIHSSKNDLYIHIKRGDIFNDNSTNETQSYAQPPLCFYQNIIENYKFDNIYIISFDKSNPIIKKLLHNYPNIIFNNNDLKYNIALLYNAYNVVASISSFFTSIVQLNNNLNSLWDFNIYQMMQKITHFHYDIYNYPQNRFTVYRMEPSPDYKMRMLKWNMSKNQRKLLLKDKCNNFFRLYCYTNYNKKQYKN